MISFHDTLMHGLVWLILQRYGQVSKDDHHERVTEVKAPSLADEFQRVAEEKAKAAEKDARVADQGVASQTAAKAFDGTEEAVSFHGDVEATKEKYKDHEPGSDYRRRGNW